MKKSFVIILHVGFWIMFLALLSAMAFVGKNVADYEASFLHFFDLLIGFILIPCLFSFYVFYLWLFPKYLQPQKWWNALFYGTGIALGGAALGCFYLVNISPTENSIYETCVQQGLIFSTAFGFLNGIVAIIIRGFITWFEEIKLKSDLLEKNHEMEMALVKAQLDPHFLFNTINNIDVLILKNAEEASTYLNKLSDIMRFMLFDTKPKEIMLSKEMEYIEKYIELQKIRTSNIDYVNYSINGNPKKKKIAPMVFIPFIENAFKHATNKKLENAININIQIDETSIQLACENKFDRYRKVNGSNGLGNDLIKKRLHLIYPQNHHLEIANQNNSYRVNLTINNV